MRKCNWAFWLTWGWALNPLLWQVDLSNTSYHLILSQFMHCWGATWGKNKSTHVPSDVLRMKCAHCLVSNKHLIDLVEGTFGTLGSMSRGRCREWGWATDKSHILWTNTGTAERVIREREAWYSFSAEGWKEVIILTSKEVRYAGTSWTNRNVPRPRHPSLGSFSYWEKHRGNEGPVPFLSRSITGGKFFTLSGMNKKAQLRTSAPGAWRFSTEAPAALAKTAFSTRTVDTRKGFGIPRNTWSLQPPNCPTGFTFHIFLLVLEHPEF